MGTKYETLGKSCFLRIVEKVATGKMFWQREGGVLKRSREPFVALILN